MEFKAKIDSGGRVLIPSQMRQMLRLESGDELLLNADEHSITLTTVEERLAQIQEKIAKVVPENVSLTDELLQMRRQEQEREERQGAKSRY